jgi:ABC-type branched-subunit amino acid transport system ATPase component
VVGTSWTACSRRRCTPAQGGARVVQILGHRDPAAHGGPRPRTATLLRRRLGEARHGDRDRHASRGWASRACASSGNVFSPEPSCARAVAIQVDAQGPRVHRVIGTALRDAASFIRFGDFTQPVRVRGRVQRPSATTVCVAMLATWTIVATARPRLRPATPGGLPGKTVTRSSPVDGAPPRRRGHEGRRPRGARASDAATPRSTGRARLDAAIVQFDFANQTEFAAVSNGRAGRAVDVDIDASGPPRGDARGAPARSIHGRRRPTTAPSRRSHQASSRRAHPRDHRRERRRQVDAHEDPGRHRAADGGRCASMAPRCASLDAHEAAARGIGMIHQELQLFPDLTVAENLFVGRERLSRWGTVDWRPAGARARRARAPRPQAISPTARVGALPLGQQQIVEIARALVHDTRVLLMDEPTSALTSAEIPVLFEVIRDLARHGVAIVYISHRLEELLAIADVVTVLRDGRVAGEAPRRGRRRRLDRRADDGARSAELTGRRRSAARPRGARGARRSACRRGLVVRARRRLVRRRAGEVLGLYGLMGAGRTELLESLLGVHDDATGRCAGRPRSPAVRRRRACRRASRWCRRIGRPPGSCRR